jgi:hypothetical protein
VFTLEQAPVHEKGPHEPRKPSRVPGLGSERPVRNWKVRKRGRLGNPRDEIVAIDAHPEGAGIHEAQ